MIISHKLGLVFVKARKTASTSVEVALAPHCGPDDVLTPQRTSPDWDSDEISHTPRNSKGWNVHATPAAIKENLAPSLWGRLRGVVVVRNPWRQAASLSRWNDSAYHRPARQREPWGETSSLWYDFTRFYLVDNEPWAKSYLRFERINKDWRRLCRTLGIEYRPLPRLKDKMDTRGPLSAYMTPALAQQVAVRNRWTIERFNYRCPWNYG